MKLKKLFLFLGIFVFMFIPKNVYAVNHSLIEFNINNVNFANSNASYSFWGIPNASLSVTVNDYDIYNYYVIYFISTNTSFSVELSGGCSTSCFAQNSYVKLIDKINNYNYYAIVLPLGKADCGVGTGQCIISNTVVLKSANNYNAIVLGVEGLDNDSVINNQYSGFLNVINNQNSNTQTMVTSFTTNIQNMITNATQNALQQHQDLQNLNDTMNSEEAPSNNDVSNKTTEWTNKLAGTGPVSNMVLMPITLLNAYTTGMSSTCSPYNLGDLMGTDLILPCIDVSDYLGASLWGVIDVLFSGFMIYAMGKKFVKIFNDFTNLRDNQMDELYGGGK